MTVKLLSLQLNIWSIVQFSGWNLGLIEFSLPTLTQPFSKVLILKCGKFLHSPGLAFTDEIWSTPVSLNISLKSQVNWFFPTLKSWKHSADVGDFHMHQFSVIWKFHTLKAFLALLRIDVDSFLRTLRIIWSDL